MKSSNHESDPSSMNVDDLLNSTRSGFASSVRSNQANWQAQPDQPVPPSPPFVPDNFDYTITRPGQKRPVAFAFVLTWIVVLGGQLAGGIYAIIVSGQGLGQYNELPHSGLSATATVYSKHIASRLFVARDYVVNYTYEANGRRVHSAYVDKGLYDRVERGTQLNIFVSRTDPNLTHIAGDEADNAELVFSLWLGYGLLAMGIGMLGWTIFSSLGNFRARLKSHP